MTKSHSRTKPIVSEGDSKSGDWRLNGPRILVEPPGPNSKAAMKRKEKFVTVGLGVSHPVR